MNVHLNNFFFPVPVVNPPSLGNKPVVMAVSPPMSANSPPEQKFYLDVRPISPPMGMSLPTNPVVMDRSKESAATKFFISDDDSSNSPKTSPSKSAPPAPPGATVCE